MQCSECGDKDGIAGSRLAEDIEDCDSCGNEYCIDCMRDMTPPLSETTFDCPDCDETSGIQFYW